MDAWLVIMEVSRPKKPPDENRDVRSNTEIPTVMKRVRKGSGMTNRRNDVFRKKKNVQFQDDLSTTLMRRLNIDDPTSITAIVTLSSVLPTVLPVSFRAVPLFLHMIWMKMESIGTRSFKDLNTPFNAKVYCKVFLYLCEAKISYAQINCKLLPPQSLTSRRTFSDQQLRLLKTCAENLVYPLAICLESLGSFITDQQPIIPILAKPTGLVPAGAVSYAPSDITKLVQCLRDQQLVCDQSLLDKIVDIPGVAWDDRQPFGVRGISPDTVAFWTDFSSDHELNLFNKINSSMSSKKGFVIRSDITSGNGSVIQAIRYPNAFGYSHDDVLFYTNTQVSSLDLQLAPALQFGIEHDCVRESRLCGSIDSCLQRGVAVPLESAYAVIWSETS